MQTTTSLFIEIQRVQRSLADCLFHNEDLHKSLEGCIACENAKLYVEELKVKREALKQKPFCEAN